MLKVYRLDRDGTVEIPIPLDEREEVLKRLQRYCLQRPAIVPGRQLSLANRLVMSRMGR